MTKQTTMKSKSQKTTTMSNLINLKENELKALTWMDDVTGLVAEDKGDTVEIYYQVAPSFFSKSISKADFAAIVLNTTEKLN